MESLDGILIEENKQRETVTKNQSDKIQNEVHNQTENHTVFENLKIEQMDKNKQTENNLGQIKSDSESGFDESGSQMSRSGIEDRISTLDPDMLSRSASFEKFNLDQLHLELKSVATDWQSFRHIHTCSCAMPFDHFTKKARGFFM